uniref:Uncharacterized protein n=1 Tax=Strongyloides papillosus TaxID=174720 RepID=A0A0N5BR04_STREA
MSVKTGITSINSTMRFEAVTEAIGTNSQNNETEVPSSTKVESKKNSIDRELAVFLETNLKVLLKQNRRPAFTDKKYSKMTVVEKRETQKYVYFLYKQIRMKVEKKVNGLAEAFLVKINNYFLHKSFPISIKNMQKCCQDKIRHENDLNEDNTQPKKMEKK